MQSKIIENEEIEQMKISSLPTRPTASSAFGGKGYTAAQMKAAFDRLPLFIIEKFNTLISDISDSGENSIANDIKTGIRNNHTLKELCEDITDGTLSSYLCVMGEPLGDVILSLKNEIEILKERLL